jgi:copper chaperone NosL
MLMFLLLLITTSCSHDPQPINYGIDNCSFCKMTIMDDRFAAQLNNKKGKSFVFDDVHCLYHFIKNGGVWSNEIEKIYLADYARKGNWIEAEKAFIIHSESFKSPMGGNYASFSSEQARDSANKQVNGEVTTWNQINSKK